MILDIAPKATLGSSYNVEILEVAGSENQHPVTSQNGTLWDEETTFNETFEQWCSMGSQRATASSTLSRGNNFSEMGVISMATHSPGCARTSRAS